MAKGTGIFTVVFKSNLTYIPDFINALKKQSLGNFNLILVNEDIESSVLEELTKGLNIEILEGGLSIHENREILLKNAAISNYDNILFMDSDDYPDENYVATVTQHLKTYDCVISDLSPFDNLAATRNYWKDRISNEMIPWKFLIDKNIAGLGNTALKKKYVKPIEIPSEVKAIDWYVFSILLQDCRIFFNTDSTVNYRQYDSNDLGIGKEYTQEYVEQLISNKKEHYEQMVTLLDGYQNAYNQSVYSRIDATEIRRSIPVDKHHFWYEEISYE